MGFEEQPVEVQHELLRMAFQALVREHEGLNYDCFKDRLRTPIFSLTRDEGVLARYCTVDGRIEVSLALLTEQPWDVVSEVLKHEMVHQFVFEVMGIVDEAPHGPSFLRICEALGIDARSQGLPTVPDDAERKPAVLDRVRKLLSLAQSPNENEAQAAMNAAQRLMLKHNLKEVGEVEARGYGYLRLGEPTGRVRESQRILARILLKHFFVDVIWMPVWRVHEGKRGSVIEVCGTPANLELASYVHSFLMRTADRLWLEHKRALGIRKNRDRQAYLAGVMSGFLDKLNAQQKRHVGEGLVWVGDPRLKAYMKRRHPHVRSVSYGSSIGSAAHESGRAAGRQIVLHQGVGKGPAGGTRLLRG
ncbi:MAG: SprT-like domain-containing protein [Myxococcales bacterium]|nr:SprT-like domain-containing protein [Myxococcales bacterium]